MDGKRWLQQHQVAVYAVTVALAVGITVRRPDTAGTVERFIDPVLAVLLYVTFLEIPFVRLRRAFTNVRFVAAALGTNFLVVPVVVWVLTRFLPPEPVVLVGALVVLLTPCIDYVITFTDLAGGDAEQITATTPALMFVQLLLLPVSLWLFVGPSVAEVVRAGPFVEAFLLIIALPLALALPAGYELAPAVVVTQTLVELCGMVVLTRVVPRWLVPAAPTPVWGSRDRPNG